ncbi:MAG: protein phosphatase 2C domain-containing protein [Burkholderiaceae bacterium]|nr:protein phosphatase 2C domain-containing protein [Burkholderiaceae bacterium]
MASPTNFNLDYALASHAGQVRPLNEDAIGARPDLGLFVLCDGLGGYNAGEIAATMAVSALLSSLADDYEQAGSGEQPFDPRRALEARLIEMNGVIARAAADSAAFEGMATTIVVAWIIGERLWVAHAGDSRLYRFRAGVLEALTRDHSFSQELLDAGMVRADAVLRRPDRDGRRRADRRRHLRLGAGRAARRPAAGRHGQRRRRSRQRLGDRHPPGRSHGTGAAPRVGGRGPLVHGADARQSFRLTG